ncbi:MAG: DsbC family protein [Desulfuromonadales bacterium]|nr:DsbC family protein [Desulfuromonadales bacterium]
MRNRVSNRLVPVAFFLSFCCFAALYVLNAGGESDPSTKALEAFRNAYQGTAVESMTRTEIPGLFEVVTGGNLLYFAPEGNYLIIGEIFTTQGKSITAGRREELIAKRLKELPLDVGVRIGNGRNRVIEFTDPDCPFCRKASAFFNQRTDVSRYVFFAPLVQLHPDAERKTAWILGAKDREKAYQEVMDGQRDKEKFPEPDSRASGLVMQHRQLAARMGVTGTPQFWINGKMVQGANIPVIEKLLTEGGAQK